MSGTGCLGIPRSGTETTLALLPGLQFRTWSYHGDYAIDPNSTLFRRLRRKLREFVNQYLDNLLQYIHESIMIIDKYFRSQYPVHFQELRLLSRLVRIKEYEYE